MMYFDGRKTVVEALSGSHNYNLNTPTSDMDWKYFVIPTFGDLYYGTRFSKAEQGETLDYSCHDIRSLAELLWKANLNFVEVLFSVNYSCEPELEWMFHRRTDFSTMNLHTFYNATYGMHHEKMKTLFKGTAKTQGAVEEFGFDTKQACHAMRCLFVLERFMKFGDMGMALRFGDNEPERKLLLDIKAGKFSIVEFYKMVNAWNIDNLEDVDKFYKAQVANEDLRNELDDFVKDFIKKNLQ